MKTAKFVQGVELRVPPDVAPVLSSSPRVLIPQTRKELIDLAVGGRAANSFEVAYELPDGSTTVEAEVVRARNGVVANYPEPYMRRRDPECLVVADAAPSDKTRFEDRYGQPFDPLRQEIFDWLGRQELVVVPFFAGQAKLGYDALAICPMSAAFFAAGLADLQGMVPASELNDEFEPQAIIYVAPPFRQTHFDGKQVVIHSRRDGLHEIFSLNLYPGPSAKKGVYGVLISIGETEGWITAHASTVQVVTPYDNVVTILHEGASGGGKSEMLEYAHREADGRLLLGMNTVDGDVRYLALPRGCRLWPVTDDMALCHPEVQSDSGRLVVEDAEEAWFLRINHINEYGVDPQLEKLCIEPKEPLIFLNMDAVAQATCLIWEHIEDAPGKPCPNPRVIMPRRLVPNIVNGPVEVDVRSFGIRTPPCTAAKPNYGIFGLLHLLPPSLAWLWRLVAPRGHGNPSITDSSGLTSEGVGSYWPFATGRRVDQANLLLQQIISTPKTRYTLSPNQHVGAWKTGFMPQWIAREYLARRGSARFRDEQLVECRCPLLGWTLASMLVEGTQIPPWLMEVQLQREVGVDGYDAGAQMLVDFFKRELRTYLEYEDLNPLGRQIIECCLDGGSLADYRRLIPQD